MPLTQPINDPTHAALAGARTAIGRPPQLDPSGSSWLYSREDIKTRSPSRLDGIDLKEEENPTRLGYLLAIAQCQRSGIGTQPIDDPSHAALTGAGTAIGRPPQLDPSSSSWLFSLEDIKTRSPSRLDGIDKEEENPTQPINDPTHAALAGAGTAIGRPPQLDPSSSSWLFSREDIETRSPSRLDGIDLKEEEKLRRSYCKFIRDLGMQLKVPQITIAAATVFCHRFYLRQSHSKNDRYTVASSCMFLAGKSEDTPRHAISVARKSYEILHGDVSDAVWKGVGLEQKNLVLRGECLVLNTLWFDIILDLPYKSLVVALKRVNKGSNLARVAWNFVNNALQTTLFLQFKAHYIALGAIFLAAKLLKIELSTEGEKDCWQELGITHLQLEDISTQFLEQYKPIKIQVNNSG